MVVVSYVSLAESALKLAYLSNPLHSDWIHNWTSERTGTRALQPLGVLLIGKVSSLAMNSFVPNHDDVSIWTCLQVLVQRFNCSLFKHCYTDFRMMDRSPKLEGVRMSTWHANSILTRAAPTFCVGEVCEQFVQFVCACFTNTRRYMNCYGCCWFLWSRLVNSIGLLTTCDRQLRSCHAPFCGGEVCDHFVCSVQTY